MLGVEYNAQTHLQYFDGERLLCRLHDLGYVLLWHTRLSMMSPIVWQSVGRGHTQNL